MPDSSALVADEIEEAPFFPLRYRVLERRQESPDVARLLLAPIERAIAPVRPGQFTMLTSYGVGEVAISVSGIATEHGLLEQTIRDVGPVSGALANTPVDGIVGVRGPFGTDWGIDTVGDADVVIVAGGLGLAPLHGVITTMVERTRSGEGRLFVLIGARSPDEIIFREELASWRDAGAYVAVTVDVADSEWTESVGLVTALVPAAPFDPTNSIAMVCGPEIMMRFTARALIDAGITPAEIRVSLERNMQCGIGLCGHCQLGPLLLCRDGPIVTYSGIVPELMKRREL